MKGPKNQHVIDLQKAAAEKNRAGPGLTIAEWRKMPDCREFARRYQVWALIDWYHRTQVQPQLGVRAWFRRKWRQLRGKPHSYENLSIFQRVALEEIWAEERRQAEAKAAMRDALEQDLEGHRN